MSEGPTGAAVDHAVNPQKKAEALMFLAADKSSQGTRKRQPANTATAATGPGGGDMRCATPVATRLSPPLGPTGADAAYAGGPTTFLKQQ